MLISHSVQVHIWHVNEVKRERKGKNREPRPGVCTWRESKISCSLTSQVQAMRIRIHCSFVRSLFTLFAFPLRSIHIHTTFGTQRPKRQAHNRTVLRILFCSPKMSETLTAADWRQKTTFKFDVCRLIDGLFVFARSVHRTFSWKTKAINFNWMWSSSAKVQK